MNLEERTIRPPPRPTPARRKPPHLEHRQLLPSGWTEDGVPVPRLLTTHRLQADAVHFRRARQRTPTRCLFPPPIRNTLRRFGRSQSLRDAVRGGDLIGF